MKTNLILSSIGSIGLLACACGDIGSVQIGLTFTDPATQAATRRLAVIVRESPRMGQPGGCDSLWTMNSNGLAQNEVFIDYPNRNDLVASAVMLSRYPNLTLLVYAYPSKDTMNSTPIAGGCQAVPTNQDATTSVTIKLDKPPSNLPMPKSG